MLSKSLTIAFLGTGAIGASLVRALYLNKVPFTIIVRDKKRKADLIAQGIKYRLKHLTQVKLGGIFEVNTITEIQNGKHSKKVTYDFIFLGMKTPNLKESAKTAKKLLNKNGKIILLQNGLPELAISGFRPEQVISGIVGYNTALMPDGSYFQSNPGHLILGIMGGLEQSRNAVDASKPLPHELKSALEPHQPTELTHNALGFRWNKLAINSVINGLGAVTGLALGEIFSRLDARRVAIALIKEAAAVMKALAINEGIVPGAISVYKLAGFPAFLQHLIIYVLGRKYAKIRTSMLQDIDRGMKTEVGEIHGAIVTAAKSVGVKTPVTAAIVEQVHDLEAGKGQPDVAFLRQLIGAY